MTRTWFIPRSVALLVPGIATLSLACQSGGVGDPCIPEAEYNAQFQGFKRTEENIESRSFQCETRVCLVNHFQGRVSCPLGQRSPVEDANDPDPCLVPGTSERVQVSVVGQCEDRQANDAVYCSCRCGPPEGEVDDKSNFCDCPSGFVCEEIRPYVGLGDRQLAGKYCIKIGTRYEEEKVCAFECTRKDEMDLIFPGHKCPDANRLE